MTIPANLIAGLLGAGSGKISLSIVTPLSGSNIPNNTTAEAITGMASSTGGNITGLQYSIDGGAWNNFTFTPAPSVSYSGGNAGQLGAGSHTVAVKATDASSNTTTVTSSYTITASPPAASYSWTPANVYTGNHTYLTVANAAPLATVAYSHVQYNNSGGAVASGGVTTLGTTDASGNFSYTGTANWVSGAIRDVAQLFVGGTNVGSFTFNDISVTPSYSYGPSTAPNGTTTTLSIAGSYGSATVSVITAFSPSGIVQGPTVLGSTDSSGNFSYNGTASWGSDTSCSTMVSVGGNVVGTFTFVP